MWRRRLTLSAAGWAREFSRRIGGFKPRDSVATGGVKAAGIGLGQPPLHGFASKADTSLGTNGSCALFCLSLAWRKIYLATARRSISEDSTSSPGLLLPTLLAAFAASIIGTTAAAENVNTAGDTQKELVDGEGELKLEHNFGPGHSMYIPQDHLRLVKRLNEGSFGQVWLGELDDGTDVEEVAVKVLSKEYLNGGSLTDLLKVEAEVFQRVSSRCHHVCRLYGVSVRGEELCLVMKLYKKSLSDLLQEEGGRLRLSEIQKYGVQICKGLVELHEQGVIMQDLKPANVLIDDLDNAVLADFGMASVVDRKKGARVVTAAKGTPSYMAPEAWDPRQTGGVSTKTDIWSLGCTIIELFEGLPPFYHLPFENIAGRVRDRMEAPAIPKGLPPSLAQALERCFAYSSEDRPEAREMLQVFLSEWEAMEERECPPVRQPVMVQGSYYVPETFDEQAAMIQGSYYMASTPEESRTVYIQGSYYVPIPSTDSPPMIQGSLYVPPGDGVMNRVPSLNQLNEKNQEMCRAVSRFAQMVEVV